MQPLSIYPSFSQMPGVASLTNQSVLVTLVLVTRQQGTHVPSLILSIISSYLDG